MKAEYVRLRRRLEPRYVCPSSDDEPLWRAAAARLAAVGGTAESYIRFAFEHCLQRSSIVYVNMATSEKILARYAAQRPRYLKSLHVLVNLQAETVEAHLNSGESIEEIVLSPEIQLGPLFRYVASLYYGRPDLAVRFKEEAEELLREEPIYRELLKNWLPEDCG